MTPTADEVLASVRDKLSKGDIAGAKAAADAHATSSTATAAAAEPAKHAEPRKFEVVMLDLVKGIHNLMGNNPAIVPLIDELQELVAALTPAASTS